MTMKIEKSPSANTAFRPRTQTLHRRRRTGRRAVVLRERRVENRPLRSGPRHVPEFTLAAEDATPVGITVGGDGNLWFAQKSANRIGRITPHGEITEFPLPSPYAGPDGIALGPDGNVWFSETEISKIGRITPDGHITEFGDGITFGAGRCRSWYATARCGSSEAAGNRVGRITIDGTVTEFPIQPRQPAARHGGASGRQHLVRRDLDQRARPHRPRRQDHRASGADAGSVVRGVTVGADGDLWYTANAANKIGRMAPDGKVRGEYDIPTRNSGARCIAAFADGRLFFTQYDAGMIGEVVIKASGRIIRHLRESGDPA